MRRTPEPCHFRGGATVGTNAIEVGIRVPLVAALRGSACASEQPTSTPSPDDGPHPRARAHPTEGPARDSADPTDLDAASIASDAVDVAALEGLLDQAGFVGGTQRQFSRVRNGRRRILARVLMFQTPRRRLRLRRVAAGDHGDEVIGEAAPTADLRALAPGVVLVHEPNPCCHNETRMFLAMWHEALNGRDDPDRGRGRARGGRPRTPFAARRGGLRRAGARRLRDGRDRSRPSRGYRGRPRRPPVRGWRGRSDLPGRPRRRARRDRVHRRLHLRRGDRRLGRRPRVRLRERRRHAGSRRPARSRPTRAARPSDRCASRTSRRSTRPGKPVRDGFG